jgi:hypothetical protein
MESDVKVLDVVHVAKSGVGYSSAFDGGRDSGFYAGEFESTGGSVTITLQACMTNSLVDADWHDPVDSDGNAIGQVIVLAAPAKKFVQFGAVLAPCLRFKYTESGSNDSYVTSKLVRKL